MFVVYYYVSSSASNRDGDAFLYLIAHVSSNLVYIIGLLLSLSCTHGIFGFGFPFV